MDEDLSPRTGSRRFTYEVTRRLQSLGHEVKLFTSRLNEHECFEEYLSLPVTVVPEKKVIVNGTSKSLGRVKENVIMEVPNALTYCLRQARNALRISQRIADSQCDVALFHYHGEHWLFPYFYNLDRSLGVVYLNVIPPMPPPMALPFQESPLSRRIVDKLVELCPVGLLEKNSSKRLQLFITPSKFQLRQGKKYGIIGQKKAAVVPLGVDHEKFYPTKKPERFVLYLGRIHPHKSLELAILSMKDAPQDWSIVIAGDIERQNLWYKKHLISLAEQLGIADKLNFILSPSDFEVIQLMRKCSVFLFPSTIDTFGLVVLEAMACGKPIVACNRGGVPEIVNEAGFLLEPSVNEWRASVHRLLSDSSLRRKMGKQALKRSEAFSWETTATKLLTAFRETICSRTNDSHTQELETCSSVVM